VRILETRGRLGSDGQHEWSEAGKFTIAPGMTADEMTEDLATIERSMQPAPRAFVAKSVALLAARTRGRAQGEGEARLVAATMVEDLGDYPEDVVAYAVSYWVAGGQDGKWFPAWSELREICERRVRGRQRLKRALEFLLAGGGAS
jgi:hypothetical protein